MLTRLVFPFNRSRTKTSSMPFVSPLTRLWLRKRRRRSDRRPRAWGGTWRRLLDRPVLPRLTSVVFSSSVVREDIIYSIRWSRRSGSKPAELEGHEAPVRRDLWPRMPSFSLIAGAAQAHEGVLLRHAVVDETSPAALVSPLTRFEAEEPKAT